MLRDGEDPQTTFDALLANGVLSQTVPFQWEGQPALDLRNLLEGFVERRAQALVEHGVARDTQSAHQLMRDDALRFEHEFAAEPRRTKLMSD